jgi:hypothetical protein
MSDSLRVFVNGQGVSVPQGSTVLDAVRAVDPEAAKAVEGGTRAVADSRGIAVPASTPVTGGYVMRLVSARQLREGAE